MILPAELWHRTASVDKQVTNGRICFNGGRKKHRSIGQVSRIARVARYHRTVEPSRAERAPMSTKQALMYNIAATVPVPTKLPRARDGSQDK